MLSTCELFPTLEVWILTPSFMLIGNRCASTPETELRAHQAQINHGRLFFEMGTKQHFWETPRKRHP